ncbi:MAG: hypothetical protein AB1894_23690 [Chloroflexota bacterium]
MKTKIMILVFLLASLCSCQTGNSVPTPIATTHPTLTDIPRWQLYEAALLKATIKMDGLCECAILGTSGNEVYVYTLCQATGPRQTAMSVPAVIYLSEDGAIEDVVIPRSGEDYPKDIETLFPVEIQEIIYGRKSGGIASSEHLRARIENGGPPLVVVLGTPMP